MSDYGLIGLFFCLTLVFPIAAMAASWMFRPKPKKKEAGKLVPYECGVDTQGPSWIRFRISYFLYALVFVAFDVEVIFLFPWAVKFNVLGPFAFIEMLIFIFILVLALWYAWKERALEWH